MAAATVSAAAPALCPVAFARAVCVELDSRLCALTAHTATAHACVDADLDTQGSCQGVSEAAAAAAAAEASSLHARIDAVSADKRTRLEAENVCADAALEAAMSSSKCACALTGVCGLPAPLAHHGAQAAAARSPGGLSASIAAATTAAVSVAAETKAAASAAATAALATVKEPATLHVLRGPNGLELCAPPALTATDLQWSTTLRPHAPLFLELQFDGACGHAPGWLPRNTQEARAALAAVLPAVCVSAEVWTNADVPGGPGGALARRPLRVTWTIDNKCTAVFDDVSSTAVVAVWGVTLRGQALRCGNTERGRPLLCVRAGVVVPALAAANGTSQAHAGRGGTYGWCRYDVCKPKSKSKAACSAAVARDGMALQHVPQSMQTEALCLAAVCQTGRAIQYVDKRFMTPAVVLAAVSKDATGFSLNYVPIALRTVDVCVAAVRRNDRAFAFVPLHLRNCPTLLMAFVAHNSDNMAHIQVGWRTPAVCWAALTHSVHACRFVPVDTDLTAHVSPLAASALS